jgi:hypothetical protein
VTRNGPALGGITRRDAAADPTRRDELARLIASFPEIHPSSGIAGCARPDCENCSACGTRNVP